MKYNIGFIGAGKMAEALISAILKSKLSKSMIASDVDGKRLEYIKTKHKINITKNNKEVIHSSDIVVLAVKPQIINSVLEEIKETNKLIVSIAAGITIKHLESKLKKARVIRVMPNTPCLVGEMAAGFSKGTKAKQEDVLIVEEILNSSGKAFYLNEDMLDAVTALSGSGPAFIARLLEWMIEGAKKEGLKEDVAQELAYQTAIGTGRLLQEKGITPKELVDMVSSPNGTTVAGRDVLENSDVKEILMKTIEAAAKRSKELGKRKPQGNSRSFKRDY